MLEEQIITAHVDKVVSLRIEANRLVERRGSPYDSNLNYIHQENVFDLISLAFTTGFKANPASYTKEEVQALLEEQIKLAAEAAELVHEGFSHEYRIDKQSILNCPRVKLD